MINCLRTELSIYFSQWRNMLGMVVAFYNGTSLQLHIIIVQSQKSATIYKKYGTIFIELHDFVNKYIA